MRIIRVSNCKECPYRDCTIKEEYKTLKSGETYLYCQNELAYEYRCSCPEPFEVLGVHHSGNKYHGFQMQKISPKVTTFPRFCPLEKE